MDKNILLARLTGEFKSTAPNTTNLDNPEFDKSSRVHDWRNYVSLEFKDLWPNLSIETRLFIAIMAQEQADKEEWD